ncbi:MAG: hypothetical protein HOD64_07900, partial [Candidatus Cloacimonetes bacterium]|nr:hypothetical protein [Candidatus Cloacimonadota bacterium]
MKKLSLFIVAALFLTSLVANVALPYDEELFLPNRIIVGFEWDTIGNRECILEHELTDGVVETGIAS